MRLDALPAELQNSVFDHLEPDELIAVHRSTKALRRRINGRGLLPGRVAELSLNGLFVPGRSEQEGFLEFGQP
ncbi:unnamed protein product, partial [Mesorhabditis spiculigera]